MSIVTKLFGNAIDTLTKTADSATKMADVMPSKVELPPPENAQKTQLGKSTIPTYEKAYKMLDEMGIPEDRLDYGAGRGIGAQQVGAMTYEPFSKDWNPDFTNSADIPDESFSAVTSFNVLNVVPREMRDQIVTDIARILKPNGTAIISTRGRDVLNAKGKLGDEPMSIITTAGTYQKGFTPKELREYAQELLGSTFEVKNVPKLGQAAIQIKKLPVEYADINADTLPQPLEGL
jgi:SAM-dependent methyltransferase